MNLLNKKTISDYPYRDDHPNLNRWRLDIHNFFIDCAHLIKNERQELDVLEISGQEFGPLLSPKTFHRTEVQESFNPDFLCPVEDMRCIKDNSYDVVICAEVLEHAKKPWLGADEILRVTKESGFILITTPCDLERHACLGNNSIVGAPDHKAPHDFWRYIAPESLELLFSDEDNIKVIKRLVSGDERFPNGVGILARKNT